MQVKERKMQACGRRAFCHTELLSKHVGCLVNKSLPTLAGSRQNSTTENAISSGLTFETSMSLMIIIFYISKVKKSLLNIYV